MPDRARYVLVPIDAVRPLEAAEGRWCGHAALPGGNELHTLTIEARDGAYVGYRPDCEFVV